MHTSLVGELFHSQSLKLWIQIQVLEPLMYISAKPKHTIFIFIFKILQGEIQPHGVDGELCVRGPHIIKEYWEEPEKTKEAIDENRWYKNF